MSGGFGLSGNPENLTPNSALWGSGTSHLFPTTPGPTALSVDAAREPIGEENFFPSAYSFARMRGGQIEMATLGAMELAAKRDLADWTVPGKTETAKILSQSSLPITAIGAVDMIITGLAILRIDKQSGMRRLFETARGTTNDEMIERTAAPHDAGRVGAVA